MKHLNEKKQRLASILPTKSSFLKLSPLLLASVISSTASAALIVDFTVAGGNAGNEQNVASALYSSEEVLGGATGVSFDITVTAVIPASQQNAGGLLTTFNGGVGSEVENTGAFVNVINGVPEVLRFTISNIVGLGAGESIVLTNILSQNPNSLNADQSGGYGGTFGNAAADSVTLTSDNTSTIVINQSDAGSIGSILLNGDNGQVANTGNTFRHASASGDLAFTSFFDLRLTDLGANNAVVVQGFEFDVVPEPSSTALLSLGGLALIARRRRA